MTKLSNEALTDCELNRSGRRERLETFMHRMVVIKRPTEESCEPATFTWHNPSATSTSRSFAGLRNFFVLRGTRDRADGLSFTDFPSHLIRKAPQRAITRAEKILNLFRADATTVGELMMCNAWLDDGKSNVTCFPQVWFGEDCEYMFMRTSPLFRADIDVYDHIHLITGSCIFDMARVKITADGRRIPAPLLHAAGKEEVNTRIREIVADPSPCLYELESATRLARTTGNVLAAAPAAKNIRVSILVPRAQYYLYFLWAAQRGLVSSELLYKWIQLVDRRHRTVVDRLRYKLQQWVGYVMPHTCPQIGQIDSLEPVEDLITNYALGMGGLDLACMCQYLSQASETWQRVLQVARPQTWSELGKLSYCVAILKAGTNESRTLTINVMNPEEKKMFESTTNLSLRTGLAEPVAGYAACGLYPLERIILSEGCQYMMPYHGIPGHVLLDRSGVKYTDEKLVAAVYSNGPEVR